MRRNRHGLCVVGVVVSVIAAGCAVDATDKPAARFGEIDTSKFDASGRVERSANIDFRIGGEFELWFAPDAPEGSRGSEDCRFLSYLPDRMLSFTWNAPPSIPDVRERRAWVVVEFEPLSDTMSRVRLAHTGFGEGEAWDKTHAYFEQAWPGLLGAMQAGFAESSSSMSDADALAWFIGTWRGTPPGGGATEAVWSAEESDTMLGHFQWHTADGSTLLYEIFRFPRDGDRMLFEIRHFGGGFEPWDAEIDGPTTLVLHKAEVGRAEFRAPDDAMDLRSIVYMLDGDTMTATSTQRGMSPLVMSMSRVP